MCNLVGIDQTWSVEVLGSLERFLMVFHALRLPSVRSVDVMTSSITLSPSLVLATMVVSPNGLLEYCFLYAL